VELQHPIDDPKLPSYQHPVLREVAGDLQRAYDAFNMMRGVKERYLPQEPKEPPEAYKARLDRSVFADFFRGSITAFAGVLSKYELVDAPQTLLDAQNNIDRAGNSLAAALLKADTYALRDGAVVIQVDMPQNQSVNRAAEIANGVSPYFILRERARVLNWFTTIVNGVETLDQVTILELKEIRDPPFGVKTEPRYRVIDREGWQVYEIKRVGDNLQAVPDPDDQGSYLGPRGEPLAVAPVIWYSPDGDLFGNGAMLLRQVVEHSVEHFQQRSDLREKTHKCAMPVPVAMGLTPSAPGEPPRQLVLGPNSVVELQPGGSFNFAEPSASSLVEQRAQIAEVEKLISRQTLGFLYGDPGATKTATQAGLEGAQTEATVESVAQQKASMVQSLMKLWCMFTGETLSPDAGIQMSATLFEPPMTAADTDEIQKLTGGATLLSKQSAIEELMRRGRLRLNTTAEDELQRIQDEEPLPADLPDVNADGGLPPES
jgi:hypothetical protein